MALSTLNLVFCLRRKRTLHDVTMLSATSHTVPLHKSYYVAQSGETGILPLETISISLDVFQARNSGKGVFNYALFSSNPSVCVAWSAPKLVICFCTQFPQIRIRTTYINHSKNGFLVSPFRGSPNQVFISTPLTGLTPTSFYYIFGSVILFFALLLISSPVFKSLKFHFSAGNALRHL